MSSNHQHEKWQMQKSAKGGMYCAVCGQSVPPRCPLCEEVVTPNNHDARRMGGHNEWAHRECLLRSVLGGIGHLEDHQRWCIEAGDPDGGRTYRQSALEVDQWVHRHGI